VKTWGRKRSTQGKSDDSLLRNPESVEPRENLAKWGQKASNPRNTTHRPAKGEEKKKRESPAKDFHGGAQRTWPRSPKQERVQDLGRRKEHPEKARTGSTVSCAKWSRMEGENELRGKEFPQAEGLKRKKDATALTVL